MVEWGMAKSPPRLRTSTIGRSGFAKISAVEGIKVSRRAEEDFRSFDRQNLSAAERRAILLHKYGHKARSEALSS